MDTEEQVTTTYDIRAYGTGHEITVDVSEYTFLGTVKMYNGLTFHIFYKRKQNLELRTTYWTPYVEMEKHIGKKFIVLRKLTIDEIGDSELEGQLFKIKLEDGTEINAWFEEIFQDS